MTNIILIFVLCIAPLAVIITMIQLKDLRRVFNCMFGMQFLIIAANMVMEVKTGMVTLSVILFFVFLLFMYSFFEKTEWKAANNIMLWIWGVLGIFYIFEIINPNNVQEAWNIAIVQYFIIPMVCAVFVPICIRSVKAIEQLLLIWSVFILIGILKGLSQKFIGYTSMDFYQLYALEKWKTHLIWSGTRYFSCFSDAANFGVHMAMAMSILGIAAFNVRKRWMKIYFLALTVGAIYALGLSGTRSAIAIPLGALVMYACLSLNPRTILTTLTLLAAIISFFMFTYIGQGNEYIRKMRTAFRPKDDPSYVARMENRAQMKILLAYKPFGYGLGLAKGGERFDAREVMPYPPDSWLVAVWVETGIIGLVFYLVAHGIMFCYSAWILMLKIKHQRLRGLIAAWLCTNVGFFLAAYANDIMTYPNPIIVYIGFALCIVAPHIDKLLTEEDEATQAAKEAKKQVVTA